jgi:hypothetical protein
MQRAVQVPSALIDTILGLVVLFVVGSAYWTRRLARQRGIRASAAEAERLRAAGITIQVPRQNTENGNPTGTAAPQKEVQQ